MKHKYICLKSDTRLSKSVIWIVNTLHKQSWYRTDRQPMFIGSMDYDFFTNVKTGRFTECLQWDGVEYYTLKLGNLYLSTI